MMAGRNQHVTPHSKGGWQVKGAGNSRATVRTATQKESIAAGRIIAQNQHLEFLIHGVNGKIRAMDSRGHDSFPSKGKEFNSTALRLVHAMRWRCFN